MPRSTLAWVIAYLVVIALVCSLSVGILACCGAAPSSPNAAPALFNPALRSAPTSPQTGAAGQ